MDIECGAWGPACHFGPQVNAMRIVRSVVLLAAVSTLSLAAACSGGRTTTAALAPPPAPVKKAVVVEKKPARANPNAALNGRSWFQYQLDTRGLNIREGPHAQAPRRILVMDFMAPLKPDDVRPHDPETDATPLDPDETLEAALRRFDESGETRLPVVDPNMRMGPQGEQKQCVIAFASQVAALRAHTKALVALSEEEHR